MAEADPDPRLLVHLCGPREWDDALAAGAIRPVGGGFVHLSTQRQVHLPAGRLFAGRTDMLLLYVDIAGVDAPLRWEPGVPGDPAAMLFPHLYGVLPVGAVVALRPYPSGLDGTYRPLIPRIGHRDG